MRIGQTRLALAFALGLFAWVLSADAQQPRRVPLIGILSDESPSLGAKTFEAFAQGMRELGWVEGQNLSVERCYAAGNNESLLNLAGELVRRQPDVIFAVGTPAARAAKTATQTKTTAIGSRNGSWNTRIRFCVQTVYMPSGKTAAQKLCS